MTNAEYIRKLRSEAKAMGYCGTCRARPAKPGRVTCQHCLDRHNESDRRAVEGGLCKWCRKPRGSNSTACADCLRRKRLRYEANKAAAGKCARAGCHWSRADGKTYCALCLHRLASRASERRRRKIADGKCGRDGCWHAISPGHTMCEVHLEALRVRNGKRAA